MSMALRDKLKETVKSLGSSDKPGTKFSPETPVTESLKSPAMRARTAGTSAATKGASAAKTAASAAADQVATRPTAKPASDARPSSGRSSTAQRAMAAGEARAPVDVGLHTVEPRAVESSAIVGFGGGEQADRDSEQNPFFSVDFSPQQASSDRDPEPMFSASSPFGSTDQNGDRDRDAAADAFNIGGGWF